MFEENWLRLVIKQATGTGKTKVLSLLIAWCYFHKEFNENSELSKNFLILAPNTIVLDRLKTDIEGLNIFNKDPIIPPNHYEVKLEFLSKSAYSRQYRFYFWKWKYFSNKYSEICK